MTGGENHDRHDGGKSPYDAAATKDRQAQKDSDDIHGGNHSCRCSGMDRGNSSLCAGTGTSEIRIQIKCPSVHGNVRQAWND